MNKKSIISFALIIFIVVLALGLRIFKIGDVPSGLFCDEAIRGLDAYLLTTTGRDSHGEPFPIFFKVFGEYTPPIQTYSEVFTVLLFGLNESAIRLTSALYGTISVVLIYLLSTELFSKKTGLVSAFFLAITPWSVHYSRTGFEYNSYLVFFLLSLLFWLKGTKRARYFLLSFLFWGLTFYTYNPAKLIVWVFLMGLIIITRKAFWSHKKIFFLGIAIFSLISLPSFFHILSGKGLIRFGQVSLFADSMSLKEVALKAFKNYFYHYSPNFLFFKGDPNVPNNRHFSLGLTPLLVTTFPFLLIGTGRLFLSKNISFFKKEVLFLWMALYPLSGTLTLIMSTNRAMIGVGLLSLLTALGLELVLTKFARLKIAVFSPLLSATIILGITINFLSFYRFYLNSYPLLTADFMGWQFGPREIMNYFLQVKEAYDDLYMSGEFNEGQVFLKFYDPENTCKGKCKIGDFWREPKIYQPSRRQLFSLSPEYLNKSRFKDSFSLRKKVYYPNGKIAFYIGEVRS